MTDCPFCRFITGELPGIKIIQDPLCTAFMSLQPINPGHILIVPTEHIAALEELPLETGDHLFRLGRMLADAIRASGVICEGINFWLADGKAADQMIPHLQLHVIPRFAGDEFEMQLSPRSAELPTREELEKNAYHIKQALDLLAAAD